MWGILIVASLGIGGIVVPASIMTTIVCPDDLIATVTALTLSIRVLGGSIGYCAYYNIFVNKFTPAAIKYVGGTLMKANVTSPVVIKHAIELTSVSLLDNIKHLPGIEGNEALYQAVVYAGKLAYAEAYKYVYYASIAFGGISVIAAVFLGDIGAVSLNFIVVSKYHADIGNSIWMTMLLWLCRSRSGDGIYGASDGFSKIRFREVAFFSSSWAYVELRSAHRSAAMFSRF